MTLLNPGSRPLPTAVVVCVKDWPPCAEELIWESSVREE
jgi:hypothetical protein